MKFVSDKLIENLKLKRSLLFWKSLFALFVVLAFSLSLYYNNPGIALNKHGSYVARLTLDGFINENRFRQQKILELAQNKNIKALILHVNSPGGTIVGGESLYNALRKFASAKPLVVVMEGMAASGGYMISAAADYIVAHQGTITGSIGVIMQLPDLSVASKKLGIGVQTVRSGDLKGGPSIFEKLSEKEKRTLQDSLCVAYDYFKSIVLERRGISDDNAIKQIATGKIFLGRQALDVGLIDKIGDEFDAISWLKEKHGITDEVRDITLDYNRFQLPLNLSTKNWKKMASELYLRHHGQVLAVMPLYFSGIDIISSFGEW